MSTDVTKTNHDTTDMLIRRIRVHIDMGFPLEETHAVVATDMTEDRFYLLYRAAQLLAAT